MRTTITAPTSGIMLCWVMGPPVVATLVSERTGGTCFLLSNGIGDQGKESIQITLSPLNMLLINPFIILLRIS